MNRYSVVLWWSVQATRTSVPTGSFWPRVERKPSSEVLGISKVHLAAVVGTLTVHCQICLHEVRLNVLAGANCHSCMERSEVESTKHFHLYCPTFARQRLKQFGRHTFREPSEVTGIDISSFKKSVVSSKRFDDLRGYGIPYLGV